MLQMIARFLKQFEKVLCKHENFQGMCFYLSRNITEILVYFQLEIRIITSENFRIGFAGLFFFPSGFYATFLFIFSDLMNTVFIL